MTEFTTGTLAAGSIVGLALMCFFYMWGGRSGKWKRRFVGALIGAVLVNLLMLSRGIWSLWFITIFPSLSIAYHLGYGSDIPLVKELKRTIYCLGVVGSGLICATVLGGNAWVVFPLHLGVGAWSIWLGVKNPLKAAAEETFVCLLLNTGLIMYPFLS